MNSYKAKYLKASYTNVINTKNYSDLRSYKTCLALLVLEHLSKQQNAIASNNVDLPEAFGANTPYVPFMFVKSITLSSPYENMFENSNRFGDHVMFLVKVLVGNLE